jgi:F-type H+-transporting ATPase subunit b
MLEINVSAVITQAIAFILLALVAQFLVFPRITAQLDERSKHVSDTLEQIASDRQLMESTRAEYEQRLAGIEAEAREKIAGAVKQAQEEAAGIMATARQESAEQRERALADIDLERKKAMAEIRAQMADLAVLAASKVLEREITPAVHRELINDFVKDVAVRS